MELVLRRIFLGEEYTVGHLWADGRYVCDTLEPVDRGLDCGMKLSEILGMKRERGVMAIPTGVYSVTLEVKSPRFGNWPQYAFCEGRLPRLVDVPGYEGVLLHIGNYREDTQGCVLVGRNLVRGQLLSSAVTFRSLYGLLEAAVRRGEDISMRVTRRES